MAGLLFPEGRAGKSIPAHPHPISLYVPCPFLMHSPILLQSRLRETQSRPPSSVLPPSSKGAAATYWRDFGARAHLLFRTLTLVEGSWLLFCLLSAGPAAHQSRAPQFGGSSGSPGRAGPQGKAGHLVPPPVLHPSSTQPSPQRPSPGGKRSEDGAAFDCWPICRIYWTGAGRCAFPRNTLAHLRAGPPFPAGWA